MKILVIRFSSIGDIVLTFPVLRCIKEQIANSEVHFVTKKAYSELIDTSGSVDKCHFLDDSLILVAKQLKQNKFDVVIDLHNNLRSRFLSFYLGVNNSYRFPKLNFLKWFSVRFKQDYLPKTHVVDRYFEAVRKIAVFNDGKNNSLVLQQEIDVNNELNLENNNYITVAVGAQFETKQIPPSKLKEILLKIDFPIVLLGGKMDESKANSLIDMLPEKKIVNACGKYSLTESASILKKSKLLITGDTGLMHIAACFNIPIYVLWGNTTPSFGMFPYKPEGSTTIHSFEVQDLSCRPCSKIGFHKCPKGHFNCMMMQNPVAISNTINRA